MADDDELLLHALSMTSRQTREWIVDLSKRRCPREYVDDVVQDTFLTVLKAIRRGKGPERSPRGWLTRITLRIVHGHLDRRSRRAEEPLSECFDLEDSPHASPRMPEAMRADIRIGVARLWPYLSPRQREVLVLALEEATQREIAAALDCSLGTIAGELKNIRSTLRRLLDDLDPDPPPGGSRPVAFRPSVQGPRPAPPPQQDGRPPTGSLEQLRAWLSQLPAFREEHGDAGEPDADLGPERALHAYLDRLPAFVEETIGCGDASPSEPRRWVVRWIGPLAIAASIAGVWFLSQSTGSLPAFSVDIGENPPPHRGIAAPSDADVPRRYALDGAVQWKIRAAETYSQRPDVRVFLVGEQTVELDISGARTDYAPHGSVRIDAARFDSLLPPSAATPPPGRYQLLFVVGAPGTTLGWSLGDEGPVHQILEDIELRGSVRPGP